MEKRKIALVLFGGEGKRFGSDMPKQFVEVGHRPLMVETLSTLGAIEEIQDIYLVSLPSGMEKTRQIVSDYRLTKIRAIIPGGASRADSVFAGLSFLKRAGVQNDDLVLIQDGDRPYVDARIVKENYAFAEHDGAAVTALPVTDSVLSSKRGYEADAYLPRTEIYCVQTPQTFRFGLIHDAHAAIRKKKKLGEITDDGSIVKALGGKVKLVQGDARCIKITTPMDLSAYLQGRLKP